MEKSSRKRGRMDWKVTGCLVTDRWPIDTRVDPVIFPSKRYWYAIFISSVIWISFSMSKSDVFSYRTGTWASFLVTLSPFLQPMHPRPIHYWQQSPVVGMPSRRLLTAPALLFHLQCRWFAQQNGDQWTPILLSIFWCAACNPWLIQGLYKPMPARVLNSKLPHFYS